VPIGRFFPLRGRPRRKRMDQGDLLMGRAFGGKIGGGGTPRGRKAEGAPLSFPLLLLLLLPLLVLPAMRGLGRA